MPNGGNVSVFVHHGVYMVPVSAAAQETSHLAG